MFDTGKKDEHRQEVDPKLMESLFRDNYAGLCFFALKMIGNNSDAEDIVQDCFIRLWKREGGVFAGENWKAFLYQSVRNACLNTLRHTEVEKGLASKEITKTVVNEETPLDLIIRSEMIGKIHKAVETLPPGCRQVLKLSYFESLKNEEIAKSLGVSINTVKTQKARGLKLLQTRLGRSVWYFFLFMYG
jgi:RNA polymerase sigma-70 factor (family 1)